MPSEAAFRDMILANPDDDGPRLVFADWLEESGDAVRAEFIRIQIELATIELAGGHTLPDGPCARYRELQERERRLGWVGFGQPRDMSGWFGLPGDWYFKMGPDDKKGTARLAYINRGFVESVTLSWEDWAGDPAVTMDGVRHNEDGHADAILAREPVTTVRLTTWPLVDTGYDPVSRKTRYWLHGRDSAGTVTDQECLDPAGYFIPIQSARRITPLLAAEWPRVRTWELPQQESGTAIRLKAGETIAVGDYLTSDARGRAVRSPTPTDLIAAQTALASSMMTVRDI